MPALLTRLRSSFSEITEDGTPPPGRMRRRLGTPWLLHHARVLPHLTLVPLAAVVSTGICTRTRDPAPPWPKLELRRPRTKLGKKKKTLKKSHPEVGRGVRRSATSQCKSPPLPKKPHCKALRDPRVHNVRPTQFTPAHPLGKSRGNRFGEVQSSSEKGEKKNWERLRVWRAGVGCGHSPLSGSRKEFLDSPLGQVRRPEKEGEKRECDV